MLGNISNVGNLKSHVKEVKTTIEHIGLYLGLIFYTAIGAAVIYLWYLTKVQKFVLVLLYHIYVEKVNQQKRKTKRQIKIFGSECNLNIYK